MKQISLLAFTLLLLFGCTKHDGFTLTGHVPEAWEGKPVYLIINDVDQPYRTDSTRISGGKFKIQGKFDISRYCSVVIYLDPNDRNTRSKVINFSLFLDSTAVEATCDYSGKEPVFNVTGSPVQEEFQNYTESIQPLRDARSKIFRTYTQAYYTDKDLPKAIDLARQVTAKADETREQQLLYIREHPASVVSLKIAQELADRNSSLSLKELEQMFMTLSPELQNSEMGKDLRSIIQSKQVFIGARFLDQELETPKGLKKKISDYVKPGCTTLIEFWASWCNPCRAEIPHIRETYKRYHAKGFNIISISIDSNPKNWQQALDEEQLPWDQLLDQNKSAYRAYNLSGVPSSILLNGEGEIININARGGWLDAAMQEIYD